jgi:hypothetical protein
VSLWVPQCVEPDYSHEGKPPKCHRFAGYTTTSHRVSHFLQTATGFCITNHDSNEIASQSCSPSSSCLSHSRSPKRSATRQHKGQRLDSLEVLTGVMVDSAVREHWTPHADQSNKCADPPMWGGGYHYNGGSRLPATIFKLGGHYRGEIIWPCIRLNRV